MSALSGSRLILLVCIVGTRVSAGYAASRESIVPVCERSAAVRLAIAKALGYPCPAGNCPCEKIDRTGLTSITDLVLSGRRLTAVKPGDFSGLSSLRKLDLSNNLLSGLPPGIFDDLASVEELRVARNRFRDFPFSDLNRLPRLRTLGLDGALLAEVPTDAFDKLAGRSGFRFFVPYNPTACRPFSSSRVPDPALTKSEVAGLLKRAPPPFPSMERYRCLAWRALKLVFLAAFDLDDSPEAPDESRLDIYAIRRDDPKRLNLLAASGNPLVSDRSASKYLGFAFDTAPYRLNDKEQAFGIRRAFEDLAYGGTRHVWDDATFFRVEGSKILPILSTRTYEYTEASLRAADGSAYPGRDECRILLVAKSTTLGFFNWIETSNRPDAAAVIYRWDGRQYQSRYPPPGGEHRSGAR